MVFVIEAVFFTVIVIFASLGFCDIIHAVKSARLFPGVKSRNFLVLILKPGYAEEQLRFFSDKLRWYGSEFCEGVLAVTDGLDCIETAACERYCYGFGIRLVTLENISPVLNGFETDETDE